MSLFIKDFIHTKVAKNINKYNNKTENIKDSRSK